MIKKLEIINYQSHRNTVLDFHSGVNVIIGTSDKGKSVIIRALEWVIKNRPLGLSFVSHWNIDEKDKIFNPTLCKVFIDNNIIERKRTNNFNGYIIDENKKLEAIGTDIPFEVRNIFNFSDVNIQSQFDSPFLLSQSSGEVAKFFNNLIKIDDIDKVLSLTESKKRKSKTDLKYTKDNLKKTEKELEELKWLDEASILLRKVNRINKNIEENEKIKNELNELIDKKEKLESVINKVNINELKILFDEVNKLSIKIESEGKTFFELNNIINNYGDINDKINKYKKIKHIKKYFEDIEEINNEINELEKDKNNIEILISRYIDIKNKQNNNINELEEIRKVLPDVCPVCNQPIKEELL